MKGEIVSLKTAEAVIKLQKRNKELQEENQNLKNVIKNSYQKRIDELQKQIEKLEENNEHNYRYARKYGLIREKAIEYIKSHNPSDIGICGNGKKYYYTLDEDSVDNLLEILEGKDENI